MGSSLGVTQTLGQILTPNRNHHRRSSFLNCHKNMLILGIHQLPQALPWKPRTPEDYDLSEKGDGHIPFHSHTLQGGEGVPLLALTLDSLSPLYLHQGWAQTGANQAPGTSGDRSRGFPEPHTHTYIWGLGTSLLSVFGDFFCGTWGQTQGLAIARQVLYHLNYAPSSF
jgi:hypothetical protein